MLEIVKQLEEKIRAIDEQMADPAMQSNNHQLIELNRERRRLDDILQVGLQFKRIRSGMDEANEIITAGEDEELVAMAREELDGYESEIEAVENEFKLKLLPNDPADDKAAIVEIRAGTGGDEAGLFAGDIFRHVPEVLRLSRMETGNNKLQ